MKRHVIIIEDIIGGLLMWQPEHERGDFIYLVMRLWQKADASNKELMADFVDRIIDKYHLEDRWEDIKAQNPQAYQASQNFLGGPP